MRDGSLTSAQRETLEQLRSFLADTGYQPSLRELGQRLGLRSVSSVHGRLEALERAGYIRRVRGRTRSIELVEHPMPRLPGL